MGCTISMTVWESGGLVGCLLVGRVESQIRKGVDMAKAARTFIPY